MQRNDQRILLVLRNLRGDEHAIGQVLIRIGKVIRAILHPRIVRFDEPASAAFAFRRLLRGGLLRLGWNVPQHHARCESRECHCHRDLEFEFHESLLEIFASLDAFG